MQMGWLGVPFNAKHQGFIQMGWLGVPFNAKHQGLIQMGWLGVPFNAKHQGLIQMDGLVQRPSCLLHLCILQLFFFLPFFFSIRKAISAHGGHWNMKFWKDL